MTLDPTVRVRLTRHLELIYGDAGGASAADDLAERVLHAFLNAATGSGDDADGVGSAMPPGPSRPAPGGESVLITYGDSIVDEGRRSLDVLADFVDDHLADAVGTVHVLPFFPASSDGGFAVLDYDAVRPDLGDWSDIGRLASRGGVMADVILNHGSAQSERFQEFLDDREPGRGWYVTADADADADLSAVVRPRTHPLLQRFDTAAGARHVWCTFSADQVDFDFSNPDVLVEFCAIVGRYLARGVTRFRLDAVAYLWKEVGTSCIHLPQTHEVVKLLRTLLDATDSGALIITETNVPHAENVSYFGAGDEAHVVYNFSLVPLLVHSYLAGDATALTRWAADTPSAPDGCTFLNFIASHDGLGLRPAEGLLDQAEVHAMAEAALAVGGAVSHYAADDGPRPYELNVSLADLLAGPDGADADRFIGAHAAMCALRGIPAVYIHSLLATPGDRERSDATGHARDINRSILRHTDVEAMLADPRRPRTTIFTRLRHVLETRRAHAAFANAAAQEVLDLDPRVFAVGRTHRGPVDAASGATSVIAVHNVSPTPVTVDMHRLITVGSARPDAGPAPRSGGSTAGRFDELLSGRTVESVVTLAPFGVAWLAPSPPD